MRRETSGEASLVVLQEDLDFSRSAQDLSIDGWTPGLVNVKRYNLSQVGMESLTLV